jgi:hypothetical protein
MRFLFKGKPQGQWQSRRFVRAVAAEIQNPTAMIEPPTAMIEPPTDAVELVFREFQRLDGKQRARLWQRIWCCKTGRPDVTVDDVLLEALESGEAITVNDVTKRFVDRVRMRLEKLRVRGVVIRDGRGGAHREYTYRLVRPDRLTTALVEAGGGLARGTAAD